MKKFVIYTAIFGKPGRFEFPEISIKGVDKICYTNLDIEDDLVIPVRNSRFVRNRFYEIRRIKPNQPSSVMQQRFMKIVIPDEIYDNYEYSAYVDCKRPAGIDFEDCVNQLKDESDFLTRKHPKRDCVYDEARFCIGKKGIKGKISDLEKQIEHYKEEKYPEHNGLYYTNWIFRRHTTRIQWFSDLWWNQLVEFSHRDQISLPYVLWKHAKHNMKISTYGDKT